MFNDELPLDETARVIQAYASLRSFDARMANPGFRKLFDERNAMLHRLLPSLPQPLAQCRILDVGCGRGGVAGWFQLAGADPSRIHGIDIQPERIAAARDTWPDITFIQGSATSLPWLPHRFDVVIAFTMFSSILDPIIAAKSAAEITRVLAPEGVVIWYDLRYTPFRPHLRSMTRKRIRNLFPTLNPELISQTLLPPLAERLGPLTDKLYPLLAAIPALRSHYFGLLRASNEPNGAIRLSEAEYDHIDSHW